MMTTTLKPCSTAKPHSTAYRGLTLVMALLMALQPPMAYAQVVAAGAGSRPVVDTAANGVPVIQIVAPNKAGVSHNQYQQYNVGQQGLILNNSGKIVGTQQAGYINGNPNLGAGGAKIILNEVTGNLPSQLRGYTEVAGSRAEVILANPNGITCEGCGFINTSRSVLTTGTPVFGGDGSLAAFRVSGGQINIEGAGLDGRNLDQLDLIARSVVLRGAVWSGDSLNVIAGANQVSHEGLTVTPIAGEGVAPVWGIDTALTGGMYSQKIRLLVTEAGVGVRHAGTLVAQGGDFQLDAAGQITLTGKVDAGGQTSIQTTANLDNSGTVYGNGNLNISSGGQISNAGLLAAAGDIQLAAVSLDSSGNLAAGVDRDGKVTQGSSLTAITTGTLRATGQNLAGNRLWFEGGQLQLNGAKTSAQGSITLKANQGNIDHTGGILQSGSDLTLSTTGNIGKLINDGAQLNAGGQLAITVAGLSNRGGQIAQIGSAQGGRIESSGDLDNQGGRIISNASLSLQAAQLDNQGGRVQVQNDADLDVQLTGTLDNRNSGQMSVTGTARLEAGAVLNSGGSITAGQDLVITSGQQIDNHQGKLAALKNVELTAGELNNQEGVIASVEGNTDIALYGGTLNNTLNNTQGNISAGQDLSLDAVSITNQGGTLYAKQDVGLFADQYSGNGVLLANRDLSILLLGDYTHSVTNLIQANRHLDFWLSGDLINEGTLGAVGTLTLETGRIDNRAGGLLQGDTTELWAEQINNAGTIVGNTLNTDSVTFSNTGHVFGQDIEIKADALGNQGTGVIAAGNTLNLYIATLLDNLDGGLLYSMGNLAIAASSERDDTGRLKDFTLSVLNSSADIQAEGDLEISALVLDNWRTNIVTDTRTLSSSTTLVQERDNNWSTYEIGRIYVNGPRVKQETLTQVCRQDGTCQTSSTIEYLTVDQLTSEALASQMGTVTDDPVMRCMGSNCTWTTTTVITTVSNAYGSDEWHLPEAGGVPTFVVLDLQRGGRRYVQQSTDTQEYIVSATPEARILAGRNLYLNAGIVNNEASRIEAAGSLIADVGVLNNVGAVLSNKTRETLWIGKCSDIKASVPGVLGYCGHDWIWYSEINDIITGTNQSLDATFIGNQNLSLNAVTVDNHTVDSQGLPPGGINLTVDSTAYKNTPYLFTLPGNGLYTVKTDPASRYLVETDPRFAQYGNFISSDYMLTRLGLNPDAQQKRLGDGFYEQQVVRQQLMHLSGKSTSGQFGSFDAEYQALLEAGATYAQDFNIAPGITLTQAQVAQLSHDMVWLEERVVEGQTVLVPVVYLAKNTPRDTGAIIAGGNSTTIQATDIRNSGTITSKGDTALMAAHDLINNSGKISGQSVTLIAENDLNLGIATQSLTTSPGQTFTHEGLAGRVEGQIVNLMAGQDLTLAGARIEAGDATLTAGRDLTIGSQTLTTEQHLKADGSRLDRIQTVERGSTIITKAGLELPSSGEMGPFSAELPASDNVTGGHLQLGAGRNLNIIGSRVATDGDLVAIAGEQLNILASADQGMESYSARSKEVKDKHQSQYSHAQGSQLEAGGSITLGATTLVTEGAVIRAKENITLAAETIILEASHTLDSGEGSHNKKGKGSQEQGQYQYERDQALGTIVDAGQNLTIQSTGDTLIVGGALAAGKTLQIQTGGDLALIAAQSSNFDEQHSSSSSRKQASSLSYSEQDVRQLLSTITVGEGLDISVGGNFYADTGEKRPDGTLNADRMTVNGIERGDSRQQVKVIRTGDEADDNPEESQVKGNLAAQGIRNHSNESFDPTAANAMKGGAAALEQYFASGLVQIKNNPELSKNLETILANPNGEAMTVTDASGQVRLTVAGEAKVQAVYNTLRINETYHTEEFADQGLAQAVTLVAAIVLTVYTGGTAAGSLGGMLAGEGAAAATIGTINAGIIGMTSTTFGQLVAGTDFGEALQMGLKAGSVSAVSAGIAYGIDGYVNGATNASTTTALKLPGDLGAQSGVNGANSLSTLEKLGTLKYWEQTALNATAQGVLAKVQGGKFVDGFKGSVLGSLGAAGADIIGVETQGMGLTNVITHALLGCGVAAAGGKDCGSGALGGAASAIVSPWLYDSLIGSGLSMEAQKSLVAGGSVLTAILLAEALGKDKIVAGNAAANEVLNNFLHHIDENKLNELRAKKDRSLEESQLLVLLEIKDRFGDEFLEKLRKGKNLEKFESDNLKIFLGDYERVEGGAAVEALIKNGIIPKTDYPYAGSSEAKYAYANEHGLKWWDITKFREVTPNEEIFIEARIESRWFLNTHSNEMLLPTNLEIMMRLNVMDSLLNSSLASLGYIGAGWVGASEYNQNQFALTLSALSDIGASFMLPRAGITPLTGTTSLNAKKVESVVFKNLAPQDPIRYPDSQSIPDIQKTQQSGRFNYVVTESGELILGRSGTTKPNGHIDLAQGKDVLAAGEARFANGKLISLDNNSGHYKPSGSSAALEALTAFKNQGLVPSNGYREIK